MSYLTENELVNAARTVYKSRYTESTKSLAQVTTFLSHSHKDRELIEGAIQLFAQDAQISIYVDWQDATMPESTNRETAERIKRKIAELDCFVILATKNALASRWVPWEVGIADTIKSAAKMLVIPVADASGQFSGNEYLQLYQHLEKAQGGTLGVFQPKQTQGIYLQSWLLSTK